jgi:diguanylate cyclase (GGDEF)-like protein
VARPARRWWWIHLAIHLVVAGCGLAFASSVNRPGVLAGSGVLVVVAAVTGYRAHRPQRPAPWCLLLALVVPALLLRLVVGFLYAAGVVDRLPSPWSLHLVTVAAFAAALILLSLRGRAGTPWVGMTEAGIIAGCGVVLWWALLAESLVTDVGESPVEIYRAVSPLLDLALLAVGVRLALRGGRQSVAALLLALSVGVMCAGDTAYLLSTAAGGATTAMALSQGCWLISAALIGSAALHPSMTRVGAQQIAPGRADVALRLWAFAPVLAPAVTAVSLLTEVQQQTVDPWDIVVPLGATTVTATLVVLRLYQVHAVARRHSADLTARTTALQQALHSEAELQREMRHRALHDPLTGLPNRPLLHEMISEAVHRRANGALLLADIDGFTDVNDRFGHAMGDELLVAVAARIGALLGPVDLLARPGGDEFGVLMLDVGPRTALRRGDALVAAMRRPVTVRGHELYATVSAGLRVLDPAGRTVDMLRDADLALHAAKAAGRDQLVAYSDGLREERLERTRTVDRLRVAVDDDELVVFYQPMVRLADGRFQAVEALVRWQPANRPLVLPDRFIPAAEDSGLIVRIGEWVLRRACRDAAPWHRRHGTLLSVNVSPRQLREVDFVDVVRRALVDAALPPGALILEITEGVLVDAGAPAEQAIAHLSRLRLDGIRVAVDDFGTGYSSLAYLRDLPIDLVKIDRSFLPSGIGDAAQRTVLVRAIIELASGLGLGTVAEGVEREEQAELLRTLGCERAQGFLYARPAPADDIAALLAGTARDAVTSV